MTDPAFPPHIRAALDRFDVPPLPTGFADRLIARVEAGDLPAATDEALPPLPQARLQRLPGGRWRRSGFIAGSIGLFGMVTAAAAATGFFGEPVYVPVVSEVLAKANIAPIPKQKLPPKAKPDPKTQPVLVKVQPTEESPKPASAQGKDEARTLIRSMWQDPQFRNLPRQERRIEARKRLQAAIDNGSISQADLQEAAQDLRTRRIERRAERKAARQAFGNSEPTIQRLPVRRAVERPVRPADPASSNPLSEPLSEQRPRLRERLQRATPDERAQIRERIRARRAARTAVETQPAEPQAPQSADTPLQSEPIVPVAEPPK